MKGTLVMPSVATVEAATAEPQRPPQEKNKGGRPKGSRNRKPRARSARGVVTAEAKAPDVREIAHGLGEAASRGASHLRPTADDWAKLLEKAAVYASIGGAAFLSRPGPYNTDFEMSDEQASDIMAPFSRIIARSKFNQRWGHTAMQGGEFIDAIAATVAYGVQIAPGVRAKVRGSMPPPPQGSVANANHSRPTESATVATSHASSNGVVADLPPEPPAGSWEPTDHTTHAPD